jgi:hypothetical protein
MTQPTKREQSAALRLKDFKAQVRTIEGGSSEEISGAPQPNSLLVGKRKKVARVRKRRRRSANAFS